ncbi:hypothetical protein KKG61_04825 [bacterium]|nr:hypothetical protein [bacterium]MBU1599413.1 hypothetical protein [bacterium]
MKKFTSLMVVGIVSLLFSGCGGGKFIRPVSTSSPNEKLIWSTHEKGRPIWIIKEKGFPFFVGQSEKFATEKGARDDALRHALKKAAVYINTLVTDKFQKLLASHNVSSQIADPTVVSREFEEQLSTALVNRMSVKIWYEEKWQDESGRTYWIAFLLSEVPASSIDETYRRTAQIEKGIMQKRYDEALDEKAKEQFKAALDAFDEAIRRGFEP